MPPEEKTAAEDPAFTQSDDVIEFNLDELTLREVIEAEKAMKKYTGETVAFSDMFANGQPSGAALAAFVYAIKKRDDPKFTYEDALDVKLETLGASVEDPTEAAS